MILGFNVNILGLSNEFEHCARGFERSAETKRSWFVYVGGFDVCLKNKVLGRDLFSTLHSNQFRAVPSCLTRARLNFYLCSRSQAGQRGWGEWGEVFEIRISAVQKGPPFSRRIEFFRIRVLIWALILGLQAMLLWFWRGCWGFSKNVCFVELGYIYIYMLSFVLSFGGEWS